MPPKKRGRPPGAKNKATLELEAMFANPLSALSSSISDAAKQKTIYSYEPHRKQELFHSSPAKVRLMIGGNRSGKSHAGVAEDVYWLMGRHPYRKIPDKEIFGRCVAVDFMKGVEGILLPKFKEFVPPSYLINGDWSKSWDNRLKTLTLNNGNKLEFMSYEQDLEKFAGTSRDFIHLDEEPAQSIFNENRARVIDVNGDMWLTMTPLDGFTWTYDQLYLPGLDPDEPRYATVEVAMEENTKISEEARALFLDSLDPEERKAREFGQFMSVGGKVYKDFLIPTHVVPYNYTQIRELLNKGWTLYESVDHGWNNPTAWLWAIVSPVGQPLKIYVIDQWYASETTIAEHAQHVMQKRDKYGQPAITTGDPAMKQSSAINGMSVISTYAEHGIFIGVDGVPAGPGSVNIGVEKLANYFKNGEDGKPIMQIMDNCDVLIKQLGMLRWKAYKGKMKDENNKYEEIQKKDDHAPDSLRYMATLMPDLQNELEVKQAKDETGFVPRKMTIADRTDIDQRLAKIVLGDAYYVDERTSDPYTVVGDSNDGWDIY